MAIDTSVWYKPLIGRRLKAPTRYVFEKWSGVSGKELIAHLHSIRDKAWPLGEYPCVGEWIFLLPSISAFKQFPEIVHRAKKGATILDIGCCFGQDLRRLAAYGAPTESMYALDINSSLWDLGYELFKDADRMKATFLEGDFLQDNSALSCLDGKTDVIIACQFLHLFGWENQIKAMKRVVTLSRLGTMLIGYQQARLQAREYIRPWGMMFYHNVESFHEMWEIVQQETGTRWSVTAQLVDLHEWGMEDEDVEWMPQDRMGINFVATREE
ncbi:hypothetical protein TRV_04937 [Trichophyton verrucosum HKI 0517]|uniref:Methyltransferase domain-containing protein n=1 Tax=Trichophyton verrucosum (strain HKI 0517) TaxID=663202 RepID=D4DCT2_TRIVH|nr:uncharacterized protein TRV_04937 [Trichophyton verrucosum HKI 0517]EFE40325.1 hypothetical protein TRV_04937 [Trichophyton verrucosum HKI 0517]